MIISSILTKGCPVMFYNAENTVACNTASSAAAFSTCANLIINDSDAMIIASISIIQTALALIIPRKGGFVRR